MKVVLINPPSPYLENDAAYPPSGLMYVAASIEMLGEEASIVDLTGGIDWEARASALDGDMFGITCVTPNFRIVQRIAERLPSGKPVVVGGVHPTFLPQETLAGIRCDAIVKGEAEVVIRELIDDARRGELKKVYEGGLVPASEIPKPARHLVDLHRYRPGGEASTPVYSSRGCPFSCAFCSKVTGRKYRTIPIPRVIDEVREVMGLGFRHIVFGDDDIAIEANRLRELLRAVKPFGLRFRLNQDAKSLDESVVALAAEAGCTEISFGIESGSPRILKAMNKKANIAENESAIRITKKHGLTAKAYFVVNFPGENEESVRETLEFARRARPDKWLLSAFAPLPGSPTFHHPARYGIVWLNPDWDDYYLVGRNAGFRPCFATRDLSFERQIQLHEMLYRGLIELLGPPTGPPANDKSVKGER